MENKLVAGDTGTPRLVSPLDHPHSGLRKALQMSEESVLHSLRHTYGTRLGEASGDRLTVMRLMGHSSMTVNQRYVDLPPEALERTVERSERLNQSAANSLPQRQERQLPATISATLPEAVPVTH